MKDFMLIYQGGNPDWMKNSTQEEIGAMMAKWGEWMAMLQGKNQLVDGGSPLHYAGKRLKKDGVVTDIASSELKELVSGYSIVKAKDFDEAVAITKECPIFLSPDVTVEVREVVKMD